MRRIAISFLGFLGCQVTVTLPHSPSKSSEIFVKPDSIGFHHIASLEIEGEISKMTIQDSYLYLASSKGIYIINISSPQEPKIVSHFLPGNRIRDLFLTNQHLFAVDVQKGLFLFDCKNIENPKQIYYLRKNFNYPSLYVKDTILYLLEHNGNLHIFSTLGDSLKEISAFKTGEYGLDICVYDEFLFVSNWEERLGIWDISNPQNPKKVSYFFTNGKLFKCLLAYPLLYLGDEFEITVIDISEKSFPKERGFYVLKEWSKEWIIHEPGRGIQIKRGVGDLCISDSFLFLVNPDGGITALDISDISNIREVGFYYSKRKASTITAKHKFVYVGYGNKLSILEFTPQEIYKEIPKRKRYTAEEWFAKESRELVKIKMPFISEKEAAQKISEMAKEHVKELKKRLVMSVVHVPDSLLVYLSVKKNSLLKWQKIKTSLKETLYKIRFSGKNGWIVGENGLLLETKDKGRNWNIKMLKKKYDFKDIEYLNGHLWIIADRNDTLPSEVYIDPFLGTLIYYSENNEIVILDFIPNSLGKKKGLKKGDILSSINHRNIKDISLFLQKIREYLMNKKQNITLNVKRGGEIFPVLIKYEEYFKQEKESEKRIKGGKEKRLVYSPERKTGFSMLFHFYNNKWDSVKLLTNFELTGIEVKDSNHLWITCDEFGLERTGGGELLYGKKWGKEWRLTTSRERFDRPLYDIYFIDSLTGWVVGRGKTIFHTGKEPLLKEPYQLISTKDGGKTWKGKQTYLPPSLALRSIFFIDSLYGWAVGEMGIILFTPNGGKTWFHGKTKISSDFNRVKFWNRKKGVIVGEKGIILVTENGGKTWFLEKLEEKVNLNDIEFMDSNTVWIVGEQGLILKGNFKP